MDAEVRSRIPWPGKIWAGGSFALGLIAFVFYILRDLSVFGPPPFPLKANNLIVLFFLVQIAPLLIVSGTLMLKDKGVGWLAGVITSGLVVILAIITRASGIANYVTDNPFQELLRRFFLIGVGGVSATWLAYFLLARARYRTQPEEQQPLSREGKLWSVGNLLLGAFGILFFALYVGEVYFVILKNFAWFVWFIYLPHYVFYLSPVMLLSGAVMLKNRKAGRLAAVITLVASALLLTVSVYINFWRYFRDGFKGKVPIADISLLIQYIVTLTWLVYFILARSKYGVGREAQS